LLSVVIEKNERVLVIGNWLRSHRETPQKPTHLAPTCSNPLKSDYPPQAFAAPLTTMHRGVPRDRARLEAAEKQFLVNGGVFVGTVRHLAKQEHDQLTIEAMSTEAVTTSEIEGEILDRASVQSSLRKQLGIATNERRVRPAERGIAEMMVDLYRSFAEPFSEETLFRWHRMVMSGGRNLRDVGRYRTGAEPMQVVSGSVHEPEVHFEAPPSSGVPSEMKRSKPRTRKTKSRAG
jgi:hypothetical protein